MLSRSWYLVEVNLIQRLDLLLQVIGAGKMQPICSRETILNQIRSAVLATAVY
jgi:hypothetical protein